MQPPTAAALKEDYTCFPMVPTELSEMLQLQDVQLLFARWQPWVGFRVNKHCIVTKVEGNGAQDTNCVDVQKGDVILSVNNQLIREHDEFEKLVAKTRVGDQLLLDIARPTATGVMQFLTVMVGVSDQNTYRSWQDILRLKRETVYRHLLAERNLSWSAKHVRIVESSPCSCGEKSMESKENEDDDDDNDDDEDDDDQTKDNNNNNNPLSYANESQSAPTGITCCKIANDLCR